MAFALIAAELAIGLASWGIGKLLENPGRERNERKPFVLPSVGVGTSLPYIYGNVLVENPVWIWFKNQRNTTIETTPPIPSRYADMMFSLGIPMSDAAGDDLPVSAPRLMAIIVNGVRQELGVAGAGIGHGERYWVDIDLSNGGGGWGAGGVFQGQVEFFDGRADQVIFDDPYDIGKAFMLAETGFAIAPSLVPGTVNGQPGYRYQMIAAITMSPDAMTVPFPGFDHGYMGEGTDLFSIQFEVAATGSVELASESADDDDDVIEANPAWILYDILCGRVYKLGLSTDLVDRASFEAASAMFISERFGVSLVIDTQQSAADLVLGICDMINGVIIEDHATGKLKLKLIRDDYDPLEIPLINKHVIVPSSPDDIGLEIDFYGWDDVVNQLDVEFTDRRRADENSPGWKPNRATAQRGAVFSTTGRLSNKVVKYPAVTSPVLAAKLAAREIALCSRPLMTARTRVNRTLYAVEIGDAVRMQVTGIVTDKAFRVLNVDHGQLADGVITLTLIEDVFGQTLGAYPPWGGHPPFHLPDPILDPG